MTGNSSSAYPSTRYRPWCCFRSGARSFAVDLRTVVEVIETERLVRLPHSPKGVIGLCAFRRDVIPVVRLDSATASADPVRGRFDVLILRTEQGFWGLRIDRSGTVVVDDLLEEDPVVEADASDDPPVFLGWLRRGDSTCAVIDAEATWRGFRAAAEREFRTPLPASAGAPRESA